MTKDNASSEHIIPQFMGKFDQNPTVKICKKCNNEVFSKLEENYKEDTPEGIFFQMLNLSDDNYLIKIRNGKTSYSLIGKNETGPSEEMFPFFNRDLERIPLSQIKFKKDDYDVVIVLEKLSKNKKRQEKMKNLRKLCKNIDHKTIRIFCGKEEFDDAISLLKEVGIESAGLIKPKSFTLSDSAIALEFKQNRCIGYKFDAVVSKIAFNYFAYCAIKSNYKHLLFHPNFNEVKLHIRGTIPILGFISKIEHMKIYDKNFNNAGNDKKVRLLGYTICFNVERDIMRDCEMIIAQVSLLGFGNYRIPIGAIPKELRKNNFGSAHIFDPYAKNHLQMSRNPKAPLSTKSKFSLFNV